MKIRMIPEMKQKWYMTVVRGQVTDYTIIRSGAVCGVEEQIFDKFGIFHLSSQCPHLKQISLLIITFAYMVG